MHFESQRISIQLWFWGLSVLSLNIESLKEENHFSIAKYVLFRFKYLSKFGINRISIALLSQGSTFA
jgi:hypothetical protein